MRGNAALFDRLRVSIAERAALVRVRAYLVDLFVRPSP